jgi:ADP-heptose:LPS heptosyltransferase
MDVPLGATGQFIPEIVEASESSNIDSQVFMFDNNSNEKQTYDSIIESVKDADKIWKFKGSVLIAPFAVRLPDGSVNPKSPPISYWSPIVEKLRTLGYEVIHVSGYDEPNINANKTIVNPSMGELEQLINRCTFFICVDTFLQHMANFLNKKGIVLWSQSDPKIFGYQENINLYKDSKYFRHHQFQMWTQTPYMEEAFPTQQDVIDHCVGFLEFLV